MNFLPLKNLTVPSQKVVHFHANHWYTFMRLYIIRLFKSIYGKTPHQYLTIVRIEKAQQFFLENKSVTEVCFLVGFDSISTFSGLFTKLVGKTASQYIKTCQERKSQIETTPMAFVPSCYAFIHGWPKKSNFEEDTL